MCSAQANDMSVVNGASLPDHGSAHKEIDSQMLTVKNVKGVHMTVRVAWIFRELRGVVAIVDLMAAVRGLAHKEAVHFFRQHKEKWLRTQWMGMERIALAEITVINGSPGSHRTMEDVEVYPLAELFEAAPTVPVAPWEQTMYARGFKTQCRNMVANS